jgi:hypothetical protein
MTERVQSRAGFSNDHFQGFHGYNAIEWAQETYGISDPINQLPEVGKIGRKSIIDETREELAAQGRLPEPQSEEAYQQRINEWREQSIGTLVDLTPGVPAVLGTPQHNVAA